MEGTKVSQKEMIKSFLRSMNCWVPAYNLRGRKTVFGFLGHQADRRARELAAAGEIQVKYTVRESKKFALYKTLERED